MKIKRFWWFANLFFNLKMSASIIQTMKYLIHYFTFLTKLYFIIHSFGKFLKKLNF